MKFVIKDQQTRKVIFEQEIEHFDVQFTQVNGRLNEAYIFVKRTKELSK